MAVTAILTLTRSRALVNQAVTGTVTVSNSGAGAVNVTSLSLQENITGATSIDNNTNGANSLPGIGPAFPVTLAAGATLPFGVSFVFFAPSTGPIGAGTNTYSVGAIGSVSDGTNFSTASGSPGPGAPPLGTSSTFGLLGTTSIANTGATVVTGDIGVSPAGTITGFPPGVVLGTTHLNDPSAAQAKTDAAAASAFMLALPAGTTEGALDGLTLNAGTYSSAAGMTLAAAAPGTLTLDGQGNPNAVFIFRVGTTLGTGAGGAATITLINGALPGNVFWRVGTTATLNGTAGSTFVGHLIASTNVVVTAGGTINGTLAALGTSVVLSAATTVNALAAEFATTITIDPLAKSYQVSEQ